MNKQIIYQIIILFFCEIQILSVYSQFIAIVSQTYISKHVESPIKYHKYITIT